MAPPYPFPPPPESPLFRHRQLSPSANIRNGESEQWLGEWMTSRKCRDEMVIATKFSSPFRVHHKGMIQSNFGGNGMKSLRTSIDLSLKQLQTEYIDLLYVHWWDYATSIPELMNSLNDLVVSGKVLYLGISDTPAWVVSKANQYARDHGLRQFVVYQGLWNAAIRDFERDIVPMCKDEGMGLLPFGTLGQGRFQTETAYQEREKNNPGRQGKSPSSTERAVSKVLEEIALAKSTVLTSIALSYIMHKAPFVFPIVGGRKVEHIKSNIDALNLNLAEEDIAKIDAAYAFDPGFPHTFLSGSLFGSEGEAHEVPHGPQDVWLTKVLGTFDWVEGPKAIS
ncbi:hypothetical protein G7Y89_g2269 [Cudoniella acicularis]|uniref:NADP-dependent oxidoreductase domain-containing protein n=1 Tax=Cudoniella acicularis TaxID=354080 RepID=A0A8H4RUG9_9HELO|nr:hypothetical protein G7Y89_g2269 [Cudoniella acicularis]